MIQLLPWRSRSIICSSLLHSHSLESLSTKAAHQTARRTINNRKII